MFLNQTQKRFSTRPVRRTTVPVTLAPSNSFSLGDLAGKESKLARKEKATALSTQIVSAGVPLTKQAIKQYGLSSGKFSKAVYKNVKHDAKAAGNQALAKSASKQLKKIKEKEDSRGITGALKNVVKSGLRLDIKGALKSTADVVREVHDKTAMPVFKTLDPRYHYLERKDKAVKKISQTKKDLQKATDPAEVERLQKRLKHKQKQKSKLMKNASVVGTVAGIVASFFIPGVAPLMLQALNAMKAGAITAGKSLVTGAVTKAVGSKLAPQQKAALSNDVASYMQTKGVVPNQETYEQMVQRYVDQSTNYGDVPIVYSGTTGVPKMGVTTDDGTFVDQSIIDKNKTESSSNKSWLVPALLVGAAAYFGLS